LRLKPKEEKWRERGRKGQEVKRGALFLTD